MFWNNEESPIRFTCLPEMKDVIPEPYPAKQYIPDWYKRLNLYTKTENTIRPTPTLKRCPPFLDAMCAGWIIPLAAEVHLEIRSQGEGISWEVDFPYTIVETHNSIQIATHPKSEKVALKLLNYWKVKTAPGWSCIFTPPLNRPDDNLELMSGIVETDQHEEFVNFPGFVRAPNGYLKLEKGYPLMQVIPFRRDYNKKAVIEAMNKRDLAVLDKHRLRYKTEFSHYRNNIWEKKI